MNLLKYKECVDELNQTHLIHLKDLVLAAPQIIILGNGGSNAISSHIAQDYSKKLNTPTLSFDGSARMSCYANDFGWEQAYVAFLKDFAKKDTLVILISSSGESKNILNCASHCKENGIQMVTMSGFSAGNSLRHHWKPISALHFYVNSDDYGIVECMHELILHSII